MLLLRYKYPVWSGLGITVTVLERVPDFGALLKSVQDEALFAALRKPESTGRPLGSSDFLDRIEAMPGRNAKPGRPGPRSARTVKGTN